MILDTSVRTGGDYGVVVSVNNITEPSHFLSSQVTFWGVPGDPRHDPSRGYNCVGARRQDTDCKLYRSPRRSPPPPLLTLPTSCTGPLQTSVEADSWLRAGQSSRSPLEPAFEEAPGRL